MVSPLSVVWASITVSQRHPGIHRRPIVCRHGSTPQMSQGSLSPRASPIRGQSTSRAASISFHLMFHVSPIRPSTEQLTRYDRACMNMMKCMGTHTTATARTRVVHSKRSSLRNQPLRFRNSALDLTPMPEREPRAVSVYYSAGGGSI